MMMTYITDFAFPRTGSTIIRIWTLHFLNTETLEETIFDEVEGIPRLIYAGADDACWMQGDATSHRYDCFLPDKQGGSIVYFGESDQDASIDHQETVNTTALYAIVIDRTIAEHGALWFDEVEYECCARGVFKIDLMDFNQDGTEELVMLYNNEESIFPFVDVWTVKKWRSGSAFLRKAAGRKTKKLPLVAAFIKMPETCMFRYMILWIKIPCMFIYMASTRMGKFGEVYQYEKQRLLYESASGWNGIYGI